MTRLVSGRVNAKKTLGDLLAAQFEKGLNEAFPIDDLSFDEKMQALIDRLPKDDNTQAASR